jgi:hypothetical protein
MAQGDSVEVVFDGQMGQQSVAQKALGENAGGTSGKSALATRTIALFQLVANDLFTHGLQINNRSRFNVLWMEATAAIGASVRAADSLFASDLVIRDATPAMSRMAGFGAAALMGTFRRGAGLNGDFGRGSRGPERSFPGRAFLVA